ncbi:hypothetical protein NT04LM_2999 [Listeria monocytogenes FSL F2-208]|nr:hypothetical protein NT04LM_2999 [Listeria monocytogenes FSL F2-208]
MKQVRFKVNQEKREDKNLSSLYYFAMLRAISMNLTQFH